MNQKDAVFSVVSKVLGEDEFSRAVKLDKTQRSKVIDNLIKLFDRGSLSVENQQDNIRVYAGGLVSNWLRKDPRLNGGKKHTPRQGAIGRPKSANGKPKSTQPKKQSKTRKTAKVANPAKTAKTSKRVMNHASQNGKYEEVEALYGNDKQIRAMLAFIAALPENSPDAKIVEAKLEERVHTLSQQDSGGRIEDVNIGDLPAELHVIAMQYRGVPQ